MWVEFQNIAEDFLVEPNRLIVCKLFNYKSNRTIIQCEVELEPNITFNTELS